MMKILFLILFIPYVLQSQSTYKPISNITNIIEKPNVLKIAANYEFQNLQLNAIYDLSNHYFTFATVNHNQSTITIKYLFGDKRNIDINNIGYSFGFGRQIIRNNSRFKYRTLIFGLELQNYNNNEYSPNTPQITENLKQNYYKIFAQYNIAKVRTNYNFGYSIKLLYFKITDYELSDKGFGNSFEGKSTIIINPTLYFDYKLLKSRNLFLMSQLGLSSALWSIRDKNVVSGNGFESTTETSQFLINPILKIGIQYNFTLKD